MDLVTSDKCTEGLRLEGTLWTSSGPAPWTTGDQDHVQEVLEDLQGDRGLHSLTTLSKTLPVHFDHYPLSKVLLPSFMSKPFTNFTSLTSRTKPLESTT